MDARTIAESISDAINEALWLIGAARRDVLDGETLARTLTALEVLETSWNELERGLAAGTLAGISPPSQIERRHVRELTDLLACPTSGSELDRDDVEVIARASLKAMGIEDVSKLLDSTPSTR